jgi:hypothetical protein
MKRAIEGGDGPGRPSVPLQNGIPFLVEPVRRPLANRAAHVHCVLDERISDSGLTGLLYVVLESRGAIRRD